MIGARISDLLIRQGDIEAQRHMNRGNFLGSTVAAISDFVPGVQRRRAAEYGAQQDAFDRDLDRQSKLTNMRRTEQQIAHADNAQMDEAAVRDLAQSAAAVNEWLTGIAGLRDPEAKKAAYAEGRQALIAAGRIQPTDAPDFFPGDSWVKSRLTLLLPATERFKQLFTEPEKPVPIETVDEQGNPITRFETPTAGATYRRATPKVEPEPVVTIETMENGRRVTKVLPRSQAAGQTFETPPASSTAQPNYVTLVGPDGQQARVIDGPAANALMQQGWKQYDAVAIRNQTGGSDAEALDTAREVQRIAHSLKTNQGFPGAFGVISARMPTLRQDTANAEVLLNSLRSLLTLENTGKLKGVLSNADMELLRQASTTLAPQMSEPAAAAELDRLVEIMAKVTGEYPEGYTPKRTAAPPVAIGRGAGAGPAPIDAGAGPRANPFRR